MRNEICPRWSGPLIGAFLGIWGGAKMGNEMGHSQNLFLAFGFSLGALAGSIVYISDLVRDRDEGPPAGRWGAVLGVFAFLICWLPVVGVLVGVLSTRVNRRTPGWRLTIGWIGVVIGSVITLLAACAMVTIDWN